MDKCLLMTDEQIEQRLLAMQRKVLSKLSHIEGAGYQPIDGCPDSISEQQIDIHDLSILFMLDEESRQRLNRINHALNRLKRKEYHRCTKCGLKLSNEYLEQQPLTDLCERCETQSLADQSLH